MIFEIVFCHYYVLQVGVLGRLSTEVKVRYLEYGTSAMYTYRSLCTPDIRLTTEDETRHKLSTPKQEKDLSIIVLLFSFHLGRHGHVDASMSIKLKKPVEKPWMSIGK